MKLFELKKEFVGSYWEVKAGCEVIIFETSDQLFGAEGVDSWAIKPGHKVMLTGEISNCAYRGNIRVLFHYDGVAKYGWAHTTDFDKMTKLF